MNSIIWKGVSSTTIKGLIINELPPISKPEMRVMETVIDGRNGSVIEDLGFNAYDKPITISLYRDYDINEIIKYFTGEGEVVFSNEPDKVYRAKIHAQIDYNRLLRYRQAVVLFRTQPFKYAFNEELSATEISSASGTNIVVGDIATEHLARLIIYGKSTQNGTPTLSTPIDIVSVGDDGNTTINITDGDTEQEVTLTMPLRAVPVANESIATYTDAEGNMWYADEIDLKRGVYIQRCYAEIVTMKYEALNNRFVGAVSKKANSSIGATHGIIVLCDKLTYNDDSAQTSVVKENGVRISIYDQKTIIAYYNGETIPSLSIVYPMETSIETPLTTERIEMLNSLKLNNYSTITNDENAYMSVGYINPFEVENKGLEQSYPKMTVTGNGTVEISVNGVGIFSYTFPEDENQVVIDSEKEDAYLGAELKNRNMNGEFPVLQPGINKIEWTGDVEGIEIEPRSRWL